MKSTIGLGLALTLLTSTAMAQQPPSPPGAAMDQSEAAMPQPTPQDHMEPMDEGMRHHGMEGHHKPPPRAAAFRIETNDLKIGMKCPDDEPLKACADFTLQLLDKLGTMQKR